MRTSALITFLCAAAMMVWFLFSVAEPRPRELVLWAWEGLEDMTFLHTRAARIAFYAGTVYVRDDNVLLKPRLNQIKFAGGTVMFPVFRIESKFEGAQPSQDIVDRTAAIIRDQVEEIQSHNLDESVRIENVVQIDYDATESEREFYSALLQRLRKTLPAGTRISVTALASWCLGDRWLNHAYVDEAVVMLFSMGPSRAQILRVLEREKLNPGDGIEMSIGISANERSTWKRLQKLGLLRKGKRLYVFQPMPWTPSRFRLVTEEVAQR